MWLPSPLLLLLSWALVTWMAVKEGEGGRRGRKERKEGEEGRQIGSRCSTPDEKLAEVSVHPDFQAVSQSVHGPSSTWLQQGCVRTCLSEMSGCLPGSGCAEGSTICYHAISAKTEQPAPASNGCVNTNVYTEHTNRITWEQKYLWYYSGVSE